MGYETVLQKPLYDLVVDSVGIATFSGNRDAWRFNTNIWSINSGNYILFIQSFVQIYIYRFIQNVKRD